ncbi:MAG: DNA mismatch repair endonuclease MutL [Nitrospirota bacterium]
MPNISILPDILINKIAAGEVIERPASVVRELLDNSIDSGAARIEIEILHGGKKLMKVSDDGCGMNRDDALLCFERHATSKIRSEEDLFNITSLGFRGEALAAIASVSKVTLSTCAIGSGAGTKIEIGVNHKKDTSDAPPSAGTTIEVRDIFYNTPARRKFLKSNPTELSHIIETVMQKAFAYPAIGFTLTHNNGELINAPSATTLEERFAQLYGEELSEEFIRVGIEERGLKIYGFVSKPDFTRAGRSQQVIFVNKRPVKNPTVNHAVYSAYDTMIARDRHPAYFLFLDIDGRKVDVNVHPAKREVRFEKPDEIHTMVRAAVYKALNPGADLSIMTSEVSYAGFRNISRPFSASFDNPVVSERSADILPISQTDFFSSSIGQNVQPFFYVGESFFATVTNDGLLIIDQHAAHERIQYEKFLKKTSLETEPLFLPLRIELPVKEYRLVLHHKDLLNSLGLDIGDFGENNVIVRSLPRELSKADMKGLLMDVAAGILEEETSGIKDTTEASLLKNIAARLACHKSVRGSEQLTNEELSKMMTDLEKCDEPGRCPHGRPTRIHLTLDDLRKMFKRT